MIYPHSPELAIKKLRYYARFIVVCLLLNKQQTVAELVERLRAHIEEYISTFKPSDGAEWQLVAQEILSFLTVNETKERKKKRERNEKEMRAMDFFLFYCYCYCDFILFFLFLF